MKENLQRDRLYYKIGEVSEIVGVKPHVIRYWEQEFGLRPSRGAGLRRRYRREDLERILFIKRLLYQEGLTIAGARRRIKEGGFREGNEERYRRLLEELRQELIKLKELLSP
ncbi:MAG: MerR family transcriptional regulator [Deltaproteobacteria bacterium]|nr:MAG: MerR family transcriptional regulator [Deltaproteobacteria bacterium]